MSVRFSCKRLGQAGVALLFACGISRGADVEMEGVPGGKLGPDALVERVLERDPELASLRRVVLRAKAGVVQAAPMRDPEIRLRYATTSRSAVPDPFTEVREETITERETRTRQRTQRVSGESVEDRSDSSRIRGNPLKPDASERRSQSYAGTEAESETLRSQQTTRRTTVREVVPGRNSTIVRERVVESRRESTIESGTESERLKGNEERVVTTRIPAGADPLDFLPTEFSFSGRGAEERSGRSSEQVQVVEERVEERYFGDDPYAGSEDYSVQVRLYPRHPWEKKAQKRLARGEVDLAEFVVEAMERELAHTVREAFQELQYRVRELSLLDRQIRQATAELVLKQELFEAGRVSLDEVADERLDTLDVRLEREARRVSFEAARDELASWAGISDTERFDLDRPIETPSIDFSSLDVSGLTEIALTHRAELGVMERQDYLLDQELAMHRAARIPWLSLVSGSYNYEERHGDKYRDEYSVVAGFNLPLFSWFGGAGKLAREERSHLQRDLQVLEERVALEVRHALGRVARHGSASRRHAKEVRAFRDQLRSALESPPDDSLTGRRQRVQLNRNLAELQMRLLDVNRDYAGAVLDLERVLGRPWADVASLLNAGGE